MDDNRIFQKRALAILIILVLWAAAAAGAFLHYALLKRDKYIRLGNRIAFRRGTFFLSRGKVIDCNGIVLAWTEKYYDLLYFDLSGSEARRQKIFNYINEIMPGSLPEQTSENVWLVYLGMPPRVIPRLVPLLSRYHELKITPRHERCIVAYPEVKKYIGQVKETDGHLTGISGIEKKYDHILNGAAGEYTVMLDRHKNWIKGSWKLTRKAVPGKNVKLKLSLEEIRGMSHEK
ncbi:hypothetical protein P0136_11290 [Lentisphaerota bacterium ZTH]|nr:hypothetical protein JYG24_11190 [Lentisphaerota bacterium]WET05942.1 hypothetical protein P0136_11290 [Lentisphaerota bacterium ZTH]